MKTVGLITEYNPFHNGHLYHIERAKELTGADRVVIVMSGDYVQRGTPALLSKHSRAHMALLNGASAICELPVCYASGSAEFFAQGAISILEGLGCIDTLCFGSECGELSVLQHIAQLLLSESDTYSHMLQDALKKGHSFPAARHQALEKLTGDASVSQILSEPNNILGIEYLKALLQLDSPIIPVCVTRVSNDHHSKELTPSISSATSIREILEQNQIRPLFSRVPEALHDIYQMHYQKDFPVCLDDFSLLLHAAIYSCEDLTQISGISSDFKDRIFKMLKSDLSFEELISACKTKNLTWSKISRNLLHIMLDITKEKVEKARTYDMSPYFQILGFKRSASFLIGNIKRKSSIPMVRHLRVMNDPLSKDQEELLSTEQRANQLYRTVIGQKFHTIIKDEQIIF